MVANGVMKKPAGAARLTATRRQQKRRHQRVMPMAVDVALCDRQWAPRNPIAHARVGTDFSGLDVPLAVFEQMGIATDHVFSSEKNEVLRDFVTSRFAPHAMYSDITARDNTQPRPDESDLDFYVAGIPCQAFSSAGRNEGVHDREGRGTLFNCSLDFITIRLPRSFVLENVENLTIQHKDTFDSWIASLRAVCGGVYDVHWTILQTSHHGVPQHRRRVYVVGIRKDVHRHPFSWPQPIPCLPLELFLDDHEPLDGCLTLPKSTFNSGVRAVVRGLQSMIDKGYDPSITPAIIDHGASKGGVTYGASPTLCASRAQSGGCWLLHKGRTMTYNEMLRLQALQPTRFMPLPGALQSAMNHAVGNAMSGNVLHRVLVRVAWSMGMSAVIDEWCDPPRAAVKFLS